MSLKGLVSQAWQDKENVAVRAPANYGIAANIIFTIVGGPVWIKALFAHFTVAEASGSTFAWSIDAILMQNAAVNVNGLINTIATCPLGAAAGQVIVPALLSQPPYSLANALLGQVGQGQISAPGNILCTVAGFVTDGFPAFYCVYKKLNPASQITVP